jgi:hypothetical protein
MLNENSIYDQHQKAFANVAAYVVTDAGGERVATVAFKYAASGLRTTCYFHIIGLPMVKAFASGGGYDKCSAAAHRACQKIGKLHNSLREPLRAAIKDEGSSWDRDLRDAGYNVLQAV